MGHTKDVTPRPKALERGILTPDGRIVQLGSIPMGLFDLYVWRWREGGRWGAWQRVNQPEGRAITGRWFRYHIAKAEGRTR